MDKVSIEKYFYWQDYSYFTQMNPPNFAHVYLLNNKKKDKYGIR